MSISTPRPVPDSGKSAQEPSTFEGRYSRPSRLSRSSRSTKSTGPKADSWGSRQKMDMKIFSKGTKDRGIQSKTEIYEPEGKEILKKYFGTGFIQKSKLKKVMMGLGTKSRHPLSVKEGIEARKHLKYIREIEKSLEKK